MLNIAVFGATVSYVLMMLAHIVLRSREPDLERGYRTPGGTATSGVALVLALLAVVATFLVDEKAALITLGVYAAAALYFFVYSRHHLVVVGAGGGVRGDHVRRVGAEGLVNADQLPPSRRRRLDRHGPARLRGHAGPSAGQAPRRPALRRGGARPRRRGLQLPAGRRRRHEHRRGLRDVVVGDGLRRLRHASPTWRRCGPCRGTRARRCAGRPAVARRLAGGRLAAADPAPPARPAGRAGLDGAGGHGARVHRVPRHLRGGVATRATRTSCPATSTTSTTRCSAPRGSSRCSAGSGARWPPPG